MLLLRTRLGWHFCKDMWINEPNLYSTATTQVERYTVGTLVIDLFDARTKQAIFRGTVSDTLSDEPEKNEEKLRKAVEKISKKFPPQERG